MACRASLVPFGLWSMPLIQPDEFDTWDKQFGYYSNRHRVKPWVVREEILLLGKVMKTSTNFSGTRIGQVGRSSKRS